MKAVAAVLGLIVVIVSVVGAQSVAVPDDLTAKGSCNVIPFGNAAAWANQTYISRVPASYLTGVTPYTRVNEIYFAPCGAGVWSCASIQIGIGHVPTALPLPFSFPTAAGIGSFIDYTVIWDSAVQGPFSWTATNNVWSPLGLAALGGTTFCWNGFNDIAFFITRQNATISTSWSGACHYVGNEPLRAYNNTTYQAAASSGSGPAGLKLKFDFVGCGAVTPPYETNDPASSLDFNGVQGTQLVRAVVPACFGSVITATAASTGTNLPWEACYNFAPLISSATAGAFVTGNGQVVNIDFSVGLNFLLGGPVMAPAPFPGNFTAVFNAGATPLILSMQMFNVNPVHPDGASLSQASQLTVGGANLPAGTVVGPTCDDCSVQVNVGCIAGLYGRSCSTLFLESNGRLMFGGGSSIVPPTVAQFATDAPSFGVWADWSPALGGTVTMTSPSAGIIRVDYAAVRYFGSSTASPLSGTFALIYDTNSGIASIDGLAALGTSPTNLIKLIGISGGSAVGATDPGAAVFLPTPNTGVTTNSTSMLYYLWSTTTPPVINHLDFVPNVLGNYSWFSY